MLGECVGFSGGMRGAVEVWGALEVWRLLWRCGGAAELCGGCGGQGCCEDVRSGIGEPKNNLAPRPTVP